jgi:hypothetical protein
MTNLTCVRAFTVADRGKSSMIDISPIERPLCKAVIMTLSPVNDCFMTSKVPSTTKHTQFPSSAVKERCIEEKIRYRFLYLALFYNLGFFHFFPL